MIQYTKSEIAKKIRELRLKAGLTQKNLAERIQVSNQQSIAQLESGKHLPRYDTVCKVAEALSVKPKVIMGWDFDYPFVDTIETMDDVIERIDNESSEEECLNLKDKLLSTMEKLNLSALKKIVDYAEDLSFLSKYRKTDM